MDFRTMFFNVLIKFILLMTVIAFIYYILFCAISSCSPVFSLLPPMPPVSPPSASIHFFPLPVFGAYALTQGQARRALIIWGAQSAFFNYRPIGYRIETILLYWHGYCWGGGTE